MTAKLTFDSAAFLRAVRRRAPKTIRSALAGIDEVLGRMLGAECCALEIPGERTIYVSRRVTGIDEKALFSALRIPLGSGYRRIFLGGDEGPKRSDGGTEGVSVRAIPVFVGRERAAVLSVVMHGGELAVLGEESADALTETVSMVLHPFIAGIYRSEGDRGAHSLRFEILESIGDDLMMRASLLRVMELSGGEFCAFYTERAEAYFYVMVEGIELSPRVPEIRSKVKNTYRMFSNRRDGGQIAHERVFVRTRDRNLAYLLGDAKIESYFIVPVTFDARVRGALYVGSVKRDAFTREDIAAFHRLAEESEEKAPLRFRIGGELGILERVVEALPYGCALVASDGRIVGSNGAFREALEIRGAVPETVESVGSVSPYSLVGLWEEFRILERGIRERELQSMIGHERTLAVTWVRLGGISEDVESLIMLKDVSFVKDQQQARDEMIATVAHELRTPMTAIKNSLVIMREREAIEASGSLVEGRRFIDTALRTVTRLNMLVDGLVDSSSLRAPDYTLRPARIDVRQFLEESSYLFAESMSRRGISFGIEVDESTRTLVFDRDRIEQVVQNLLSNSMKHVPGGGAISIAVSLADELPAASIPLIPWEYLWSPAFVRISVNDTGSGIPASVVEEVNRPDAGAARTVPPTHGLGLHIATRLVERHGGAFRIERTGDSGSTVSIYLPCRPETGRVIRVVRSIGRLVDEMIARGAVPILYMIVREGFRPWKSIQSDMRTETVINPTRGALDVGGRSLWPLERNIAVAVATADHRQTGLQSIGIVDAEDVLFTGSDMPGDIEIGWGIAPRDGTAYGDLAAAAIERIGAEPIRVVVKGETG